MSAGSGLGRPGVTSSDLKVEGGRVVEGGGTQEVFSEELLVRGEGEGSCL